MSTLTTSQAAPIRRFRVRAEVGVGSSVHAVSEVVAGLAVAVSIGAMFEDQGVRPGIWSVTDEDAHNFVDVRSGDQLPVLRWQGRSDLANFSRYPGEGLELFGRDLELEQLRFTNPLEAIIGAVGGAATAAAAGALAYLRFLNTRAADRRKADAEAAIAEQKAERRAAADDVREDAVRSQTELTRAQAAKTRAEAAQIRLTSLTDLADYLAAHRQGENWSAALPLALDDDQAAHLNALGSHLREVQELPPSDWYPLGGDAGRSR